MNIKNFIFLAVISHVATLPAMFKARCSPFSSAQKNEMREAVYDLIDGAKKSLLVSMFTFTDKQAARKLSLAKARGVDVRVIIDHVSSGKKYLIKDMLEEFEVSILVFNKSNAMNHNKYVVADNDKTWISSMNWTDSAYHKNCESGVLLYSKAVASFYANDFKHTQKLIKNQREHENNERKECLRLLSIERKKYKEALIEINKSKKNK
ncbi:MAG: phospholipase D-like domain-containing protein [Candidatus Dependentiae bacterium]|nr:phospholipase D-like domain-containing protein [Candidatus Dependentiae bacterium]